MRLIRPIVGVLFAITLIAFVGLNVYDHMILDHDAPVITSEKDEITVKVGSDTTELTKYLKAVDDRDGDLSEQIVIESMGPMLSDGSRKVSFVACDHSNNVGRYQCTIKYKGYRSPRIYLEEPLLFTEGKEIDLLENMRAYDVLDGDITSKIQCINTELYLSSPSAGTYKMLFQVANTAGDTVDVEFPVVVLSQEEQNMIPQIHLSEYVVYLEKGEDFNPFKYVKNVTLTGREYLVSENSEHEWARSNYTVNGVVSSRTYTSSYNAPKVLFYNDLYCKENVDTDTPGTYEVIYGMNTEDGVNGETVLTVVVDE